MPFVIIRFYKVIDSVYDIKVEPLLKLTFKRVWVEGYRFPSAHGLGPLEEINYLSGDYDTKSYSVGTSELQIQARIGGIKSTAFA